MAQAYSASPISLQPKEKDSRQNFNEQKLGIFATHWMKPMA
jgi:hypothetical protein